MIPVAVSAPAMFIPGPVVVARLAALLAVMNPDAGEPEVGPKVLSIVMEPGKATVPLPIDPGESADPEDLAT